MKAMTSAVLAVRGKPLRQASDVSATVTPHEPSRKPICCEPASCSNNTAVNDLLTRNNKHTCQIEKKTIVQGCTVWCSGFQIRTLYSQRKKTR